MTEQTAIEKVVEFEKRIADFLPGSQAVPKPIRLAMAQVAIAHGLDPFLKEVWPIPQKNRNGEITGWDLMIGIAGWRAAAHRSEEYWGRRFEKCSDEERQWLGAQQNDIAIRCIVMRRKTGQKPMEFDGYGLFRTGHEFTKMNPLQCARYRAERDAMKAAFPISLPVGVGAKVADEETGEIINGTHDDGPKWEPVTTAPDAPPIDQKSTAGQDDQDALEAQIMSDIPAPQPEPEQPRQSYRMAHVKFNGMTTSDWHARCEKFAEAHPNWRKDDGKPDMNHILASIGHAGYETVTAANVESALIDIVRLHEQKAQS